MTEEHALRLFPNIDLKGFKPTSEPNVFYNCFAWAGGDTEINWEPSKSRYVKWFTKSNAWTLENFIENYAHIGYTEITESSELEPEYEKIAIYVNDEGEPAHAARQQDDGTWTSKLGIIDDIEHRTLECLENDIYEKVKVILKRPRESKKEVDKPENVAENNFESFKNTIKNIVNVPKKEIDEQLKLESKKKPKNKKRN